MMGSEKSLDPGVYSRLEDGDFIIVEEPCHACFKHRQPPHRARQRHLPIAFQKLADLSSPVLLQTCATGKTIPKAVLELMRADGDGKPIPYFKIELENVMIANINPDSGDGGIIVERVQLAYAKIKWNYQRQSIRGGTQGNTSGGWDCSANKVC